MTTKTKQRLIRKSTANGIVSSGANLTDSGAAVSSTTTTPLINTSYVLGSVFSHTSPKTRIFMNGVSEATSTTDWVNNAWGDVFYVGTKDSGISQANIIIQKIAIFYRALTANEIAVATAEMNR